MGFWGSSLYANDCTCDIRDDYKQYLLDSQTNEGAYKKILEDYRDLIDTCEEPLLWFALADTQWTLGRLMPEVRENAIKWINCGGGMEFWEDSPNKGAGWKKTLDRLMVRLNTPQPIEKKLRKPQTYQTNPWNIGDVYAYCFHTDDAKEKGYYGKYILIQKLADAPYVNGRLLSCVQVFDKIFDEIPTVVLPETMRTIPFAIAETYMPSGRNKDFPKLNMCAILEIYSKRDYPAKHLSFVCTLPVPEELPYCRPWSSRYFWGLIEGSLLYYHSMWEEYDYQLLDDESIVSKRDST